MDMPGSNYIWEADVLPLLKKAVDTQGRDFVYNPGENVPCYYVPIDVRVVRTTSDGNLATLKDHPSTKSGCLIGVLFSQMGFPRDRLWAIQGTVVNLVQKLDVATDTVSLAALCTAQTVQDRGGSWGQAYDAAAGVVELCRRRPGQGRT